MPKALLSPTQLGAIALKNRVVMAPMTRARAPFRLATASMAEYYRQRASAGLIITEATQISQQGTGTLATPGIHTPEQIRCWQQVTSAVHQAGGRIVCQIWHSGRVSHRVFQHNEEPPVAPSAVQGKIRTFTEQGFVPTSEPRALELEEIPGVVAQYARAASNAMEAGFDGVQIHAANGYLIDQFLRDGVNRRTDAYGGSVENRCRFLLEVTDAVIDAIGADVTAVRLSPFSSTWDCHDSQPAPLFRHAVSELDRRELAFLEIVEKINESSVSGSGAELQAGFDTDDIGRVYNGPLVLNGGYDMARADTVVASGTASAISFGRPYLSTPDLVERFVVDAPLNAPGDPAAVYGGGDAGYIDFPIMSP
ncbi:alkene reductase [Kineobactrum sediminis]|uniref:Alkene reductase n=1 Tax=Kineobactrum sediminis TaxID=1905677 RepID=A0A2N5Y614_9GAMM|nr:alkene reductase [Kineobactrum sediminis]PLW83835.1 alkene reductase [Kineobactrum sediminis]